MGETLSGVSADGSGLGWRENWWEREVEQCCGAGKRDEL